MSKDLIKQKVFTHIILYNFIFMSAALMLQLVEMWPSVSALQIHRSVVQSVRLLDTCKTICYSVYLQNMPRVFYLATGLRWLQFAWRAEWHESRLNLNVDVAELENSWTSLRASGNKVVDGGRASGKGGERKGGNCDRNKSAHSGRETRV